MHMRSWLAVSAGAGALLAVLALLGGCGGGTRAAAGGPSGADPAPTAVVQDEASAAPVDPRLIAADNAFGLDLFAALNPGAAANVAISPTSVALVLQIIYNGAAGATQQAMAQALALGSLTTADLNAANAALQASLLGAEPDVELTLANSLWMHLAQNPVLPSFTAVNETYYGAMIGDLAGAPANVNAWVAGATQGLVTQILPPRDYALVDAVIANAVYFKGAWTAAFDPTQTATAPFVRADGTQVSAQLMHQTGSFPYWKGANFQALRLPYGQQARLGMLIVLPDPGVTLADVVAGISAASLDAWSSQLAPAYGGIALPRFTSSYGAALPAALSALGMGIAFDAAAADFSGIAPQTYLADVEHKVVVEVDESGTVAAGATTGTVGVTVVEAPQFTMTVDRPFFYAIRDDATGALLFIGTLVDPG